MSLGDCLNNAEPKSASLYSIVVRRVTSVEPVKDSREFLGGDSWARVGDGQFRMAIGAIKANDDAALGPVVLDGIVSKI